MQQIAEMSSSGFSHNKEWERIWSPALIWNLITIICFAALNNWIWNKNAQYFSFSWSPGKASVINHVMTLSIKGKKVIHSMVLLFWLRWKYNQWKMLSRDSSGNSSYRNGNRLRTSNTALHFISFRSLSGPRTVVKGL